MRHAILPRMSSHRVMHTDYIHTHVHNLNTLYVHMCTIPCNPLLTIYYHFRRFSCSQIACGQPTVSSYASATGHCRGKRVTPTVPKSWGVCDSSRGQRESSFIPKQSVVGSE